MSRIGRIPVVIPSGVQVAVADGSVKVTGPLGELTLALPSVVKVEVKAGRVFINGKVLEQEPYAQYLDVGRQPPSTTKIKPEEYQRLWDTRKLDSNVGDAVRDNFGPIKVAEGSYLMMGDNRDRSCDSRFWGAVQEHYIKGKAWVIYWPPSRIGRVH